jgi:hypothetical protein
MAPAKYVDMSYLSWKVMFTASADGSSATFGEMINLSNSPDGQSQAARLI